MDRSFESFPEIELERVDRVSEWLSVNLDDKHACVFIIQPEGVKVASFSRGSKDPSQSPSHVDFPSVIQVNWTEDFQWIFRFSSLHKHKAFCSTQQLKPWLWHIIHLIIRYILYVAKLCTLYFMYEVCYIRVNQNSNFCFVIIELSESDPLVLKSIMAIMKLAYLQTHFCSNHQLLREK